MADQTLNKIEQHKESLQHYLLEKVLTRISGRDGRDIIGMPRRSLFAGILSPRFIKESDTFQDKRQTSSLGLEFKVKPIAEKNVRIIIKTKWHLYYSVFPSWEIVKKHNSITEQTNSNFSILMLPVTFRRKGATSSKAFEISNTGKTEVFNLENDIKETKDAIEADLNRWHHLGTAKKQVRKIESRNGFTRDNYDEYLEEIKKNSKPQDLPDWSLSLHIESSPDITNSSIYRVKVLLSNDTLAYKDGVDDPLLDERAIFDASVEIKIQDGEIIPFEFLLAEKDYRSSPTMIAKGINCVVFDDKANGVLNTNTLPIYNQPLYRTRNEASIKFESLDVADPVSQLSSVVDSMNVYLQQWDNYLANDAKSKLSHEGQIQCKKDKDDFENEVKGYILGIKCLEHDDRLKKAFRLMNRVFYRLGQKSGGKMQSWRLFQICFIVSQLPCLLARGIHNSAEDSFKLAVMEAFEKASVLWFPTGGGKTEAYLGLIATSLIFDRLRGKTRGINTWMRFPLRMLSLQQMDRLSRVVAELNILRDEQKDIQEGEPFSIGYYVGDGVTPNRISEKDMNFYADSEDNRKRILLLRKCPYCNTKVSIAVDRTHWRILHKCLNKDCFSNKATSLGILKGSLPLFIIDNEIYRYLPSVLVGTVDKLAIAGFNRNFAHLIKGVTQQCSDHGYASYDSCLETYSSGCRKKKKSDLVKLSPIDDPGPSLLIQDEMHLLKSDLGVFNGHYEGFLQYVGQKVFLPPKVLAATATIESYNHHAFHLYLKDSDRFPVPSWEKGESFYATSKPLKNRRTYVGVLCHSKSIVDVASMILFIYQHEIKLLKANIHKVKEILNDQNLTDNDAMNILTLYDFSLAYVNKKATGSNLLDRLDQKSSEFEFDSLSKIRHELLTGDRNPEDIGVTLERIQAECAYTDSSRLDVVAATSLISHGVDLERINMMTICGMPSHYAEYVQSSSRCARSHPGVVFTCFLSKDIRELSQYVMFMPMHENMDSLIEPAAVNRFASFAPIKTIPGLISALLINDFSPDLYKVAIAKPLSHVPTL
ncbi:MAG: helicase-related protein, partial [Candidatus Omnitrophica bacterium]|nr:helicase-related protein [Candidatus Omnitrophota bacterium]